MKDELNQKIDNQFKEIDEMNKSMNEILAYRRGISWGLHLVIKQKAELNSDEVADLLLKMENDFMNQWNYTVKIFDEKASELSKLSGNLLLSFEEALGEKIK